MPSEFQKSLESIREDYDLDAPPAVDYSDEDIMVINETIPDANLTAGSTTDEVGEVIANNGPAIRNEFDKCFDDIGIIDKALDALQDVNVSQESIAMISASLNMLNNRRSIVSAENFARDHKTARIMAIEALEEGKKSIFARMKSLFKTARSAIRDTIAFLKDTSVADAKMLNEIDKELTNYQPSIPTNGAVFAANSTGFTRSGDALKKVVSEVSGLIKAVEAHHNKIATVKSSQDVIDVAEGFVKDKAFAENHDFNPGEFGRKVLIIKRKTGFGGVPTFNLDVGNRKSMSPKVELSVEDAKDIVKSLRLAAKSITESSYALISIEENIDQMGEIEMEKYTPGYSKAITTVDSVLRVVSKLTREQNAIYSTAVRALHQHVTKGTPK